MRDRFTVALLVAVAFIGGLLAMVVVARWQIGKPESLPTQPSSVAQAVPEAVLETAEPMPSTSAEETVAEPERSAGEDVVAPEVGTRRDEGTTTTPTGRTPLPSTKTGDGEASTVGETRRTSRSEPSRRASASEVQSPRDQSSSPPSNLGSAASSGSRSFGGTKTPGSALPPDQTFVIDSTQQQSNRSLGRRPASGATAAPAESGEDATPVPDDADLYEPADPVDVPRDDPPLPDDPLDEPDAEPEPELIPPARVRANPTAAVFTVDDLVPVVIEIQSGTDVGHVPFHLAFDPRVLRFERGNEGNFLGIDGAPTVFYATAASSGDAVVVGLSRLGHGPGVDGAGVLCTLNFVAVGPGTTQLRFKQAAVKDSGNGRQPSDFNAGAVSVVAHP